jgi:N-acetylneuraminic acid mutarotase
LTHPVFLSFATEDADAAACVCEPLEADGIGCWLAPRDASGADGVSGTGQSSSADRAAETVQAIRDSSLVVLVFSASANSSLTVLREIERAIAYEKPVLSLHLDDVVPNASLEYYLNLWQWLDASAGLEAKLADIVAVVREQLARTSESITWRWLDAPGGVEGKREQILGVVRGHLARSAELATDQAAQAGAEPAGTAPHGRRRSSRRAWAAAAVIFALALGLGPGLGLGLRGSGHQGAWTELTPAGSQPPGRCSQAVAYDASLERVIMFGGSGHSGFLNDTWAYSPEADAWTELTPTGTVPAPRGGGMMAYDPTSGRLILFGGTVQLDSEDGDGGDISSAETWAYDPAANSWAKLMPAGTTPLPLTGATLLYDPVTQRMLLFGGWNQSVPDSPNYLNYLWAYDPATNEWTVLHPERAGPSRRWGYAAAYDSSAGRMTVFGGEAVGVSPGGPYDDTWAYDSLANTWTELRPQGEVPAARTGAKMVYDTVGRRIIMFGGCRSGNSTYFNDIWAYDSAANTWTQLDPSGALPSSRIFPLLVWVSSAGQIVMFGGLGPVGFPNDTWAFTP